MDKAVKKRILWALLIVVISVAVDQITKVVALEKLADVTSDGKLFAKPPIYVLGKYFRLTFATNPGAFLGMGNSLSGAGRMILLNIIPALFVIFACWMVVAKKLSRLEFTGLSLIIGGGIGNIIDRFIMTRTLSDGTVVTLNREVIDFMYFDSGIGILHTGVVNVADIVISAAAVLLVIEYFFIKKDGASAKKA